MSVWLMKFILQDLTYKACLVHFDGVIVAGQMFQEQIYNLQKVFQRFWGCHLKLNLKKCQLFQKEVLYLGHVVSLEGVITDPGKLKAV